MSDKPDTWMPLVIGDYLKDTSRLNAQQHGAYLLLIMDYWVNGPPADDDRELSKIAACELAEWRRIRAKVVKFFRVEDGVWRHKRVEEELARWAEKKAAYVARASAGGRAKAAKSSASSTTKALLEGVLKECSATRISKVEGPIGHSTLTSRFSNLDFRQEVAEALGETWSVTWLDQCGWRDLPSPCIVAPTEFAASRIRTSLRLLLSRHGYTVTVEMAA